jgi:hypothetical protein
VPILSIEIKRCVFSNEPKVNKEFYGTDVKVTDKALAIKLHAMSNLGRETQRCKVFGSLDQGIGSETLRNK